MSREMSAIAACPLARPVPPSAVRTAQQCRSSSRHTQFSLLGSLENRAPWLKPQLYTSQAVKGRYRTLDLARPGIVLVHRASAKGLGFDTVVIPDAHTDAATDPTSAALRMTYYVLATP
ncbi:hypothetical protein ACWEN3_11650 [Streptomyces sp. NPDC004561]